MIILFFDLRKIVNNKGRLIIYMGIGQIGKICSDLLDYGMNLNTKVYSLKCISKIREGIQYQTYK